MRTLLIPVDFSKTTASVLRYAESFVEDAAIKRILLLKSNFVSIYEQLLPSADFVQLSAADIGEERTKTAKHLQKIASDLQGRLNIKVDPFLSELPLLRAIHQLIEEEKPDLLMTGCDYFGQESLIGEMVISLAKTSVIPVMVIPAGMKYQSIKTAVVPCDFSAISRLNLLKAKGSVHHWINPSLLVLNVDPEWEHLTHEAAHVDSLKKILKDYKHTLHYIDDEDTVNGILSFTAERAAQLIIALPGRYSFFYNLTHKSITEALTLNADRPVLILK